MCKYAIVLMMLFSFVMFLCGCIKIKTETSVVSGIVERQSLEPIQVTSIGWKAVFEEPGDNFQLYVTLDKELDYYVGDYWHGVSFELNENSYVSDAPKKYVIYFKYIMDW